VAGALNLESLRLSSNHWNEHHETDLSGQPGNSFSWDLSRMAHARRKSYATKSSRLVVLIEYQICAVLRVNSYNAEEEQWLIVERFLKVNALSP
jgi:hypothetical protein